MEIGHRGDLETGAVELTTAGRDARARRGGRPPRRGRGASATPARAAMERSADVVAALAESEEPAYGVSTGFGSLATVRIPAERREELQRALDPLARGGDGSAGRA